MQAPVDVTPMYAMHDALARELAQLLQITDPRRVLATSAGWQLFKQALHIHHTAEDDALWPALRQNLANSPDELALLKAMEAEHAAIDPLIAAIDAAAAGPNADPAHLDELIDALATGLTGHLKHEEDAVLPLVQRVVTAEQWAHFGQTHARRISPDAPKLLPWLLEDADARTTAVMLAPLPDAARQAYADVWLPAFAALDRWRIGTAA